ncbi:hypothetical protein IWX47DRAFT_630543 [Phyllosticta citricarpa]
MTTSTKIHDAMSGVGVCLLVVIKQGVPFSFFLFPFSLFALSLLSNDPALACPDICTTTSLIGCACLSSRSCRSFCCTSTAPQPPSPYMYMYIDMSCFFVPVKLSPALLYHRPSIHFYPQGHGMIQGSSKFSKPLRNAILPCKSVVWRAKPTRKVSMWTDGLGINSMSCRRAFCVLTGQKSSLPKSSRAHGSNKRLYLLPRHSSFRERSRHLWIIPHLRPRGCAFARAESRLG